MSDELQIYSEESRDNLEEPCDLLGVDDVEIMSKMLSKSLNIKEMNTKLLIYCLYLITIQEKVFQMWFDGEKITDISAFAKNYDAEELKNDENKLIEFGNIVKELHLFMPIIVKEIKDRRITRETYNILSKECMKEYYIKNCVE